jgi:hypothetical protein
MLRVKIDLVPFGNEDSAVEIGEMVVANIFTSSDNIAEYIYAYEDDIRGQIFGNVRGFDRNRGAWELVYECLNSDDHDILESYKELLRSRFSEI